MRVLPMVHLPQPYGVPPCVSRPTSPTLPPPIPDLSFKQRKPVHTVISWPLEDCHCTDPVRAFVLMSDISVSHQSGIHPARTMPTQPPPETTSTTLSASAHSPLAALKPVLLVRGLKPHSLSFSLIFIYCRYEKERNNVPNQTPTVQCIRV
jgi:hypothetical protein